MITAELSYNPYLREISVKFNGQPPHINSLVEKYQNRPLQDWVAEIPQIFHDEMNGFGFELDFYGTELDFDEVCNAFRMQGITEHDVQIVLKNDLECREIKIERIRDFLEWLEKHDYRHFDLKQFCLEHHEVMEVDFVGIVLHGQSEKPGLKNISIEKVDDIGELGSTDLTHTPILYCVSGESIPKLSKDIAFFKNRKDVEDDQVFFCIAKDCNVEVITRLLNDLGISAPNIVSGINDDAVRKYFLLYPFTDYISEAVDVFQNAADTLTGILDDETQKSKRKGDKTHEVLDTLNDSIKRIEEADRIVCTQTGFDMPPEYGELTKQLLDKVSNWESRKTKITDTDAARKAAIDFNSALQGFYAEFCLKIRDVSIEYAYKIHEKYLEYFASAAPDSAFTDQIAFQIETDTSRLSNLTESLLELKEEKYVDPKNNRIMQLFRANDTNTQQGPVLETTYYYQVWRSHIVNAILPVIKTVTESKYQQLTDYSKALSRVYHEQLQFLLTDQTSNRDSVTANLSEDEKQIQQDNEWVSHFLVRLNSIERS